VRRSNAPAIIVVAACVLGCDADGRGFASAEEHASESTDSAESSADDPGDAPEEDAEDAEDTGTTGPAPGDAPDDCVERCAPYVDCSAEVHTGCMRACDKLAPPLTWFDAACGAAADAFFACSATLSCEQALLDLDRQLDPHPCQSEFDAFRGTCTNVAPTGCIDMCTHQTTCTQEGQAATDACVLSCLLVHGNAAHEGSPACDDALAAYMGCGIEASCEALAAGECDAHLAEATKC
jgi:hypothetical protein